MPDPRISVIIPAYNEERYLPRLLTSLQAARAAYTGGADAVEIIVADNDSTDGTARVAAAHGARVVRVEKRAIAAARNGGARAARGAILAFLDADTVSVHRDTFAAIEAALQRPECAGGATGVLLERWSAGIAVTFAIFVPMVVLLNIDTGVVFCRAEDFRAVGGYDESLLVAEDVKFLMALRRRGRNTGARLRRLPHVKATVSTRKFDQHGEWHYLTMGPRLMLRWLRDRRSLSHDVLSYWYRPER